jgi:hypothetical protein
MFSQDVAPGGSSATYDSGCFSNVFTVRLRSESTAIPPIDTTWTAPGGDSPWVLCDASGNVVYRHNPYAYGGMTNTQGVFSTNGFSSNTNLLTEGTFLAAASQTYQANRDFNQQALVLFQASTTNQTLNLQELQTLRSNLNSGFVSMNSNLNGGFSMVNSNLASLSSNRLSGTNFERTARLGSDVTTNGWGQFDSSALSNAVSGAHTVMGQFTNIPISETWDMNFEIPGAVGSAGVINLDPRGATWLNDYREFMRNLIAWAAFFSFVGFAGYKTGLAITNTARAPQGISPDVGVEIAGTGVKSSLLSWSVVSIMLSGLLMVGATALVTYMTQTWSNFLSVGDYILVLHEGASGGYGTVIAHAFSFVDAFIPVALLVGLAIESIFFDFFLAVGVFGISLLVRLIPVLAVVASLHASNRIEIQNLYTNTVAVTVDSVGYYLPFGVSAKWSDVGVLDIDGTNVAFSDGLVTSIKLGETTLSREETEFAIRYLYLGIGASAIALGVKLAMWMIRGASRPAIYGSD